MFVFYILGFFKGFSLRYSNRSRHTLYALVNRLLQIPLFRIALACSFLGSVRYPFPRQTKNHYCDLPPRPTRKQLSQLQRKATRRLVTKMRHCQTLERRQNQSMVR